MKISGIQNVSMKDYPGITSAIIFTSSCNYNCPTCHAKKILNCEERIPEQEIINHLALRKNWIDGVVICGGEPTMERDLIPFLEKIRDKKLAIKLDTNGSNYYLLRELKKEKLVDYVAMDVKGPMSLYAKLTGKDFIDGRDDVGKGIIVTASFPHYEFRTTIVPVYEDEKMRWMTPEDIRETAELIYDYTGNHEHKYFLQKFVARDKDEMIDGKFAKENLNEEFWQTPKKLLEECLVEAKKILPNTFLR